MPSVPSAAVDASTATEVFLEALFDGGPVVSTDSLLAHGEARAYTIDSLRHRACTRIALSLTSAFAPRAPRERFDALTELAERVATRACELLNSAYLHSAHLAGPIPAVEARLAELGRKNLSFGDYVHAMELFLNELGPASLHESVTPFWKEMAAQLRSPLPASVNQDVASLQLIKRAREKYEIPLSSLARFVADQSIGNAKKQNLLDVLRLASTYRNAKAHHHPWFAEDPRWYALVAEHWRRVLEQVVLHPPVYALLGSVEVVTARNDARSIGSGRFACEVARDELEGRAEPLGESRLVSTESLAAGRHWARLDHGDQAQLRALFPFRSFPENVEPPAVREQRYRREVIRRYLSAGALRAVEADPSLRPLGGELGIEERRARALLDETLVALRAAEADVRGGEHVTAVGRIADLIRHFESEVSDIPRELAALDQRRAETLRDIIADQYPITHDALVRASEMHGDDVARALQPLVSTGVVRRVEPTPGRVQYRIPSVQAAEDLTVALQRIGSEPTLLEAVRPLLTVCHQFFAEEGHPELPHRIDELLRPRDARGDGPRDDEEPPRLLFAARDHVVAESSVPDLFRAVMRRFGAEPSLQRKVPFATGPRRYLVAREPQHPPGRGFIAPLPIEEHGVVFEANQSRISALKSLRQWFVAAKLPVHRAEIDGQPIEELGAPTPSDSAVTGGMDDLKLSVIIDDRREVISGSTAGSFLAALVGLLVEEGRLEVDRLPVATGRVRYLIAQEPLHANGRPFDAAVEVEGMYVETSHTRSAARSHAEAVCRALGLEIVEVESEV